MTDQYAEFHGERTERAPLTWGQQAIWKAVLSLAPNDHWLNVRRVLALPARAAITVPAAIEAIGTLVARHESLHTLIPIEPGGERHQQLNPHGRVPVRLVDAGADASAAVAEELGHSLAAVRFDYATEPPVRAGLVLVDGLVRQAVLVFSHVAVDAYAADLVLHELRSLLLRGSLPPRRGIQPIELARRQQQSVPQRWHRARDHWSQAYEQLAAEQVPRVGAAHRPRYHQGRLTSRAAYPAARMIAARHRVSTATVLLAATVTVLARHTGQATVGLLTSVSNRFQAGHGDIVSPMAQLGLCWLSVPAGAGVDVVVPRTWQAALLAYRYAYYDQAALDRALREMNRGEGDPYCMFNDARAAGERDLIEQGDPGVSPAELRGLMADSVLEWDLMERFNWRCYVEMRDVPGALCLVLAADTACLPPERIESFLRELENELVRAVE